MRSVERVVIEPSSQPPRSRTIFYASLAALLTPVALLRFVPSQTPWPFLAIESLAFWALLPAYLFAAIALARGHRRIAAWLAVLALVHVGWTFEWLPSIENGAESPRLIRVLDANLLAPRPNAALADEILGTDADVLALQELSTPWLALLEAHGIADRYPYRIVEPHPLDHDYLGIGIFSRRPFVEAGIEPLPGIDFDPIAHVDLVIEGRTVRIYSAHPGPPATPQWAAVWQIQMDWLEARLRRDIETSDVVIATGDFNLSPYSFAHRRLLALGMHEAHATTGRGLTTTWPNGVFGAPPMRLDHAYVHGAPVRWIRELPAISSDHSPLLFELGR
jgi:endonuclease/exonuclease/phosphatase (EEP) superfamily protein YafD